MFEVIRFHIYCKLLNDFISGNYLDKEGLVDDLNILVSGFIPIKYLVGGR